MVRDELLELAEEIGSISGTAARVAELIRQYEVEHGEESYERDFKDGSPFT